MSETNNSVPEVYKAIGRVLSALSVPKNGVLPGNMGGKPYITAADTSAEVKRLFVENNLIYLPHEKFTKHEVIQFKDRLNVAIGVEGSYTIISTVDGSRDEVSGVGDGLASGTAVASNIASTNALKNALLRTFLITEQSVEDSAKNGDSGPEGSGPSAAQQKINAAGTKPAPAAKLAADSPVKLLQGQIKAASAERKKIEDTFDYVSFAKKFLGTQATGWSTDESKLNRVLKAIVDGDVA